MDQVTNFGAAVSLYKMLKSGREEVEMIKNNDKGRIHKAMIKRRRNARKDAKAAM